MTPAKSPSLLALQSTRGRRRRRLLQLVTEALDSDTAELGDDNFSVGIESFGSARSISLLLPHLRAASGIVDDACLHESPPFRAHYLAELMVAGIPVTLLDRAPADLEASLGTGFNHLATNPISTFFDIDERGRLALAQRRYGLERFTDWGRWGFIAQLLDIPVHLVPAVSVILATRRPSQLAHALSQLRFQSHKNIEPVIILHGDDFDVASQHLLDDLKRSNPLTKVITVPESVAFGRALNIGIEAASGELVTKMDDDDWYGQDHILDLVHAMEYTNAHLVGKAPEWVYLAELDLTVRRFNKGAESSGKVTIAGGAMMMRRSDIIAIGGYRKAKRHIDLGLMLDVRANGGTTYRTHGFGYLLRRNVEDHTWNTTSDYFLNGSTTQIRGVALEAALVEPPNTQDLNIVAP